MLKINTVPTIYTAAVLIVGNIIGRGLLGRGLQSMLTDVSASPPNAIISVGNT